MLADVTNRAPGARGFSLVDGATRFLEPGSRARLDLADHPLHRAWAAAGEVVIEPVASRIDPPASPRNQEHVEQSPTARVSAPGPSSGRKSSSGVSRHLPRSGDG